MATFHESKARRVHQLKNCFGGKPHHQLPLKRTAKKMLQPPRESPYDWNFKLFDFKVRVAWGFWVLAAIVGWNWSGMMDAIAERENLESPGAPILLLIWALALFASILIHELGHTLAFRYYGLDSHIVLYHFGGLAIPSSFGAWNGARQRQIGAREQIVISAAGPAFQLTLALVTWLAGLGLGVPMGLTARLNWLMGTEMANGVAQTNIVQYATFDAILFPSTVWAIINLAPILPLDGGQIMRNLLFIFRVAQPTRTAHMVSIGAGGLLGLYCLNVGQPGGIMFLLFAASNWQAMQTGHGSF